MTAAIHITISVISMIVFFLFAQTLVGKPVRAREEFVAAFIAWIVLLGHAVYHVHVLLVAMGVFA